MNRLAKFAASHKATADSMEAPSLMIRRFRGFDLCSCVVMSMVVKMAAPITSDIIKKAGEERMSMAAFQTLGIIGLLTYRKVIRTLRSTLLHIVPRSQILRCTHQCFLNTQCLVEPEN